MEHHQQIPQVLESFKLRSNGQNKAVNQLNRIEAASNNSFRVVRIDEPHKDNSTMYALIEINCFGIKSTNDGLRLRPKEKFQLCIPENFPFEYPSVFVNHARFNGFAHVQWVRLLCLYLSPDTEWNISDGMYGYIERLNQWLIRAATNSHEQDGQPLHPPVAYSVNKDLPSVIVKEDTPSFDEPFWIGFAVIKQITEERIDLIDWQKELVKPEKGELAPVILFNEDFPFEYPNKAEELFSLMEKFGVTTDSIHLLSLFAAAVNSSDSDLYLVIGTPMRGAKGNKRLQHISIWSIDSITKDTIILEIKCLNMLAESTDTEFREKVEQHRQDCKELSLKCLKSANLRWCSVKEDREEVTIRRDTQTSANVFLSKVVVIWGCGALGSYIAEALVRAGVKHIVLRDNKKVNPGILVRQNYEDSDIGLWKVEGLKNRLQRINPNLTVEVSNDDITSSMNTLPELSVVEGNAYDLLIDATASNKVQLSLECYIKCSKPNIPISSVMIGANADKAIVNYFPAASEISTFDSLRKLKIIVKGQKKLEKFATEFWPKNEEFLNFQPEPGCSDPTFVGSSIDMMILVGKALDQIGSFFESDHHLQSVMFSKYSESREYTSVIHPKDLIGDLPDGYQVRVQTNALADIKKYISKSKRRGKDVCETGGLLFGQIDHASEIVWISKIIGPPSDSIAKPEKFICGVKGTHKFNNEISNNTQGSISYVGMWHTHPISAAIPSETDMEGMAGIMCKDGFASESQILLIVGHSSTEPELGIYKYSISDIKKIGDGAVNLILANNGIIKKM
ncbi:ThiF family adenylyltransferase [Vibrio europaeus]|uniref:ThiF family adenylyltransferase n=1 Tax=Vibrio europaeus TaxID=300876 RepID=UPI00233E5C7C|nr:ThiF family adenylyltransferase [Vibrio europaeus]MDC5804500.1 ThiF family adenylyltransferase [Vibrio europaeus]MDC5829539.1 ThiF family adenylyltransferase [Vibrio europaeus]MDC5836043.1 ThiF family adenylyltransferase [Vibrio europaeus]